MNNIFQAKRVITFRKEGPSKIIASVQEEKITVSVTLQIESDDYGHAQAVLDAFTAMCDPECIPALPKEQS